MICIPKDPRNIPVCVISVTCPLFLLPVIRRPIAAYGIILPSFSPVVTLSTLPPPTTSSTTAARPVFGLPISRMSDLTPNGNLSDEQVGDFKHPHLPANSQAPESGDNAGCWTWKFPRCPSSRSESGESDRDASAGSPTPSTSESVQSEQSLSMSISGSTVSFIVDQNPESRKEIPMEHLIKFLEREYFPNIGGPSASSPIEGGPSTSNSIGNGPNTSNPIENGPNTSNPIENGPNTSNPIENGPNTNNRIENGSSTVDPTQNDPITGNSIEINSKGIECIEWSANLEETCTTHSDQPQRFPDLSVNLFSLSGPSQYSVVEMGSNSLQEDDTSQLVGESSVDYGCIEDIPEGHNSVSTSNPAQLRHVTSKEQPSAVLGKSPVHIGPRCTELPQPMRRPLSAPIKYKARKPVVLLQRIDASELALALNGSKPHSECLSPANTTKVCGMQSGILTSPMSPERVTLVLGQRRLVTGRGRPKSARIKYQARKPTMLLQRIRSPVVTPVVSRLLTESETPADSSTINQVEKSSNTVGKPLEQEISMQSTRSTLQWRRPNRITDKYNEKVASSRKFIRIGRLEFKRAIMEPQSAALDPCIRQSSKTTGKDSPQPLKRLRTTPTKEATKSAQIPVVNTFPPNSCPFAGKSLKSFDLYSRNEIPGPSPNKNPLCPNNMKTTDDFASPSKWQENSALDRQGAARRSLKKSGKDMSSLFPLESQRSARKSTQDLRKCYRKS